MTRDRASLLLAHLHVPAVVTAVVLAGCFSGEHAAVQQARADLRECLESQGEDAPDCAAARIRLDQAQREYLDAVDEKYPNGCSLVHDDEC